jgi:hypothetical protein
MSFVDSGFSTTSVFDLPHLLVSMAVHITESAMCASASEHYLEPFLVGFSGIV